MGKNKKSIVRRILIILIVVAGIGIVLQAVRKPVPASRDQKESSHSDTGEKANDETKTGQTVKQKKAKADYSGLGNEQGNLENGGDQVYLENRGMLIKFSDDTDEGMFCFDDSKQELALYCNKTSCLHNDQECVSNQLLRYLVSYSGIVFGVSDSTVNEIWTCSDNTMKCFYRLKDDIYGLWGYQGYLYYMTDFGIYRLSIQNPAEKEKVLDRPVLYEYLTFYKDKMYFCSEDKLLYQADLDGSQKKRFCDEKLVSPQVCGDYLYYRSAEYDKNGQFQMKNTLKCISLKDKKKKVILDEVYQFNIDTKDEMIYYTQLSGNEDAVLNVLDLKTRKKHKITDCASAYLYISSQSDWIVFEKYEGENQEDEEAGRPVRLYCIKKDGSGEKRLDYPQRIAK